MKFSGAILDGAIVDGDFSGSYDVFAVFCVRGPQTSLLWSAENDRPE